MGLLIDGEWHDQWYDTERTGGAFERSAAAFRNWVTPDGSPGPSGTSGFAAEPGRYHLYVSLACPWAHRTLILRRLKGLADAITVSVVNPFMGDEGWTFAPGDGVVPDPGGATRMFEVYRRAKTDYTGRVTVPVLWDKSSGRAVSNESSEIIRMLNAAFDGVGADASLDLYPALLRDEIDAVNARVYETVNNGVYRAGFATTQAAYEAAVLPLFETLDRLDATLTDARYLVGNRLTEADWRLFTTLVRFDPVYVGHFKCNVRRIADYPALSAYLRDLYAVPGIAGTVDMDHIKRHYYESHETINPTRIVPIGPALDYGAPHGRGALGPAWNEG